MSNLSLAALIKSVGSRETVAPEPAARVNLRWRPDESAELRTTSAELDGHEAWGLFVMSPEDLPSKTIVIVEDEGGAYQTQVIGRRRLRDGWELELAYIGAGRRREDRTPVSGSAEVDVSNDGRYRESVQLSVDVADVSPGGMRMRSTVPISAGAGLRISGKFDLYFGVVRYCYESEDGYDIGVQFIHCDPNRERRATAGFDGD